MGVDQPIAESTLYAVDKDSREFEICIKVGTPYKIDWGDWACPVALDGLYKRLHAMYGIDSWQSLVLAMNLIHRLLTYFVEDGGKLYREKDGNEVSIAELFNEVTETPEPITPPTKEEQARIDKLTTDQLQMIDNAIVANATNQWRKVAMIVGLAMMGNSEVFKGIPDVFYAQRLKNLVEEGRLESDGNLDYMRFSEVRLPR